MQVSNARRIGFTALALVAFWVLAWRAQSIGWHRWIHHWGDTYPSVLTGRQFYFMSLSFVPDWGPTVWRWELLSLAALPLIILSLASHNHPLKLSDRPVLGSGVLFLASIAGGYWTGESAVANAGDRFITSGLGPWPPNYPGTLPCLLLPIILTTAFVIVGAWRRAVRDVEIEAVGEDEDSE